MKNNNKSKSRVVSDKGTFFYVHEENGNEKHASPNQSSSVDPLQENPRERIFAVLAYDITIHHASQQLEYSLWLTLSE